MEVLENQRFLQQFDAVHASPPCQRYSSASRVSGTWQAHPDLLPVVRNALVKYAPVWVTENVIGSPSSPTSALMCGVAFGLKVFRHRLFDCSHVLLSAGCPGHGSRRIGVDGFVSVYGHGCGGLRDRGKPCQNLQKKADWVAGMGIDWMTRSELSQAIPPAYTEFIGRQLITILDNIHG